MFWRKKSGGGEDVKESADIFYKILEGKGTNAQESVVLANAGTAMNILHAGKSILDCIEMARESLKSGKALESFTKLIDLNK